MEPGRQRPILFTTRKPDQKCALVLEALAAMNKKNLFQEVAVEDISRSQFPPFLKSVPTLWDRETNQYFVGVNQIMPHIARPVDARREVPSAPGAGMYGPGTAPAGGIPTGPRELGGGVLEEAGVGGSASGLSFDSVAGPSIMGRTDNYMPVGGGAHAGTMGELGSGKMSDADFTARLKMMQDDLTSRASSGSVPRW